MSKWLKEPLLHFLVLGGAIFAFYSMVSQQRGEQEIFISAGQQDALINTFTRTWQRPPTAEEFKGLLDDYVREEIAWREGTSMGLDDNDVIIRRRLRQKLELLAEDVAALEVPSEAELQEFLQQHQDDYLIDSRYTLQQVYFSPDRRENARADAELALAGLRNGEAVAKDGGPGDPIALPARITATRSSDIARLFGAAFADQLETAETGTWQGPYESGFGQHLVLISDKVPQQVPLLEQVREEVQRDWFSQRRREAVEDLYQRLAGSYVIEIEQPLAPEAEAGAQ